MSASSNRRRNRPQGNNKPPVASGNAEAGQIRIIAGQWRARKLAVACVPGLRPTGDRVRETLFNWLQGDIAGSHCLDLFAGSGALGFEALSRFAASVTFVEPNTQACQFLRRSAAMLGADQTNAQIEQCTAAQFLSESQRPFDIVFIDPPFDKAMQWEALAAMREQQLADKALVYVESPANQPMPEQTPHNLELLREKIFGEVLVRLFVRNVK